MDYKLLIEETKNKINGYTFDDTIYKGIYEQAKVHLDNANRAERAAIDYDHKAARRSTVGENALATKSLQEDLAARGLARSGESAMLKVNQALSLRNSLNELARAAMQSKASLNASYNKQLADLEADLADKKTAAAESEKAALNDRLAHLEALQADKEKWQADYNLELYKENNRVKELKDAIARAEAEKAEQKDEAEKAEQKAEAEKESNSGSGTDTEEKALPTGSLIPENTPSISAERTAQNILTACRIEEGRIYGNKQQQKVRRELAKLICTQGLSKEYAEDVLFALVSYGFEGNFDIGVASSKTLKWIYGTYDGTLWEEKAKLMRYGASEGEAYAQAREMAMMKMLEFMESLNLDTYTLDQISGMLWME